MVIPNWFVVISAILLTTMLSFWAVDGASGTTHELSYFYFPASKTTASYSDCGAGGSIGDCLMNKEEEEEFEMESESNRRMLAYWRRRYISYGALFRDRVPCSRRGASYYNCHPHGPVNPYTRGCSAITRCRS